MGISMVRRATIVTTVVAGATLAATAIAFACVPQEGAIQVTNVEDGADHEGSQTQSQEGDDGFIYGDGVSWDDPNTTFHHESWCGDEGGHPVEAVYAEDTDELEVAIRESTKNSVNNECPDNDNHLPEGVNDIWLENGKGVGDEDVYEWEESEDPGGHYPNGFWSFDRGPGVGCYHGDADPIHQGTINVNHDGQDDTQTFNLDAHTDNDWDDPGGDTRQSNRNPDQGDGASVLCVGDDIEDEEPVAIFAPVVVTNV